MPDQIKGCLKRTSDYRTIYQKSHDHSHSGWSWLIFLHAVGNQYLNIIPRRSPFKYHYSGSVPVYQPHLKGLTISTNYPSDQSLALQASTLSSMSLTGAIPPNYNIQSWHHKNGLRKRCCWRFGPQIHILRFVYLSARMWLP